MTLLLQALSATEGGHIYLPAGNLIQECFKPQLPTFVETNPINELATVLVLKGPIHVV